VYGGVELQIYAFLSLAVNGGEWSASCPCYITCGVSAPITHWKGSLMDARTGLDAMGKRPVLGISHSLVVKPLA